MARSSPAAAGAAASVAAGRAGRGAALCGVGTVGTSSGISRDAGEARQVHKACRPGASTCLVVSQPPCTAALQPAAIPLVEACPSCRAPPAPPARPPAPFSPCRPAPILCIPPPPPLRCSHLCRHRLFAAACSCRPGLGRLLLQPHLHVHRLRLLFRGRGGGGEPGGHRRQVRGLRVPPLPSPSPLSPLVPPRLLVLLGRGSQYTDACK